MLIPNADQAAIDRRKLTDYCLDPEHRLGKHKARVFDAALGIGKDDADILIVGLLNAVKGSDGILGKADRFGQRYIVDFELRHGDFIATIRSVWIIEPEGDLPRFVTCFIL